MAPPARSRPDSRRASRWISAPGRRALALLSGVGALWLVGFHLALLRARLLDLTISEPVVAARWLGAGALVAAAVALHRRGGSLLHGRRAVALWSLALLLHAGAAPASLRPLPIPAPPSEAIQLLWAFPLGLASGLALLAVRLLLARRPGLAGGARPRLAALRDRCAAAASALAPRAVESPRPPPTAFAAPAHA